jgi:MSHA biogenesis protein MshK
LLLIVPAQVVALDDPTRPPGTGSSSQEQRPLPNLSLESILISTNRRVAVINGQALVEGQTVDGVRVRQIHRDRVEVTASGKVKVLHLNKLPQIRGFQ